MNTNLNSHTLLFGVNLGFKLSRLEWIWGSKFDFAQKEFESSKTEILNLLSHESVKLNDSNYQSFTQSILNYYLATNIAIYSSILIGFAIQRASIASAAGKEEYEELIQLAKSALSSIPNDIVPNQEQLFNVILRNKDNDFSIIVKNIEKLLLEDNIREQNLLQSENSKKPKLFLSYSNKDSSIADTIEKILNYETNNGIEISRYTRLKYGDSFKEFMNSIQDHDFVLCIVSDNYLKSLACMYEVGEIINDRHFKKKLLFVVLGDGDEIYFYGNKQNFAAAKIYGGANDLAEYVSYWKDRYNSLNKKIEDIHDNLATADMVDELKRINRICSQDIGQFITYLQDRNGKSFEELYNNRFADLILWIFPKWESRMFIQCKSYSELLSKAIEEIWKITKTDYNQIALFVKTSNYESGLVVYADNISDKKQRYRLVVMEGLMCEAFTKDKEIIINNTDIEPGYYKAVKETKSELVIPIKFQSNVIGVINSEAEKENYYTESAVVALRHIANYFSVALTRLKFERNTSYDKIPYIHIEF